MSFLSLDRGHTRVAHPGLYWAKFYLSRRSHNHQQILGLMQINELPGLDEGQLRAIESEMQYPVVFRPGVAYHTTSQKFLRKEGIWDAWARTPAMEQALSILENRKLRQAVEMFLLSPVKPELALRKIADEEGVTLSLKAYELFRHYFWNTNVMSGVDWGEFVQERESTHREWLQLALNAKDASGVQVMLWKAGFGGLRQVEANKAFTNVRDLAYMMIMQTCMEAPSKYHSEMMLNYTKIMRLTQEGIDSSAAAVKDVVESFQAFRMRNVETKAPSVKQLTGGNFSPAEQADDGDDELRY